MCSKKKIRQINSQRKQSIGFSEQEFYASSVRAVKTIRTNKLIANMNVSSIYYGFGFSTTADEMNNFKVSAPFEYKLILE